MPGSRAFRDVLAASLTVARARSGLSREAVIAEMIRLNHPISVSTLLRWETVGNVKVEDAYYLSEVYGITPDRLLMSLPFPPSPKELTAGTDRADREATELDRAVDALGESAPDEDEPPSDEDEPQSDQSG